MCFRKILLISVLILFMVDFSFASSNQTISIALITDKASGLEESPLVSLLEVELSQKEGVQLLERAEIDTILEEQKLSAAGLLDRNSAIKVGKLLRADVFIILTLENEIEDANNLIRVRVAETAHGLRLLDYFEQPEKTNPQESVETIVQKIETIINKINQPDDKLIPVGIVDIHRVELGEKYKILERTLPTMLSVRLSLEPQIIMLEREDLKVLLDEKLRTEGEDSEFWNSAVLIDGYIQPHNGQLEMHLNLKQSSGDNLKSFVVQVEPNETSQAIAQAATNIILQLQNSPPTTKWDPQKEAEQFYKQGQMLSNHKRYEEALPIFETAHALEPDNVYYTGAVFTRILDKGSESGRYSDMEIVNMASIFVRQIRDNYEKGTTSASQIPLDFKGILGFRPWYGYFGREYSVKTEEIKLINRENREIWADTIEDALRKQIAGSESSDVTNYIALASLAWIRSDEPDKIIANLKKSFNEFLMPPESGGCISSYSERKEIYERFFIETYDHPIYSRFMSQNSHFKDSWDETRELINSYLGELTENSDPIVGIQSKLLFFPDYESFVNNLRKEFKTSKINNTKYVSEAMFSLLTKLRDFRNNLKVPVQEEISIWKEFFGYAIDNNDNDALTWLLLNSSHELFEYIPGVINRGVISRNVKIYQLDEEKRYELFKWYDSLLEQIAQKLSTNNDNNDVVKALDNLKGIQDEIKKQFSVESSIEPEKDFNVTMILNQKDWPVEFKPYYYEGDFTRRWFHLEVRNEMIWIAMGLHNNIGIVGSMGLAGIDIKQRKVVALWQAGVAEIDFNEPAKQVREISGLVIGKKNSFISLDKRGILVLPGSIAEGSKYFKTPQILTQDDGLPSNLITSVAKNPSENSEKFWVGFGSSGKESGLGIYDPQTKGWETVFCSTLNGEPPFNSGYTYMVKELRFINPEQLFFRIYSFGGAGVDEDKWRGYWIINSSNYKLTHEERYPRYSEYDRNVLRNSKIFDSSKITDRNILNGEYAETFLRTPYGLVAIGAGTVGLIEAEE